MKIIKADIFVNTSHCNCTRNVEYKIVDNGVEYDKIELSLESTFDYPENKIKNEFEQDAKIYTLAISTFGDNLHIGCPYFTLDWKNKNIENNDDITYQNNCMEVSKRIQMDDKLIKDKIVTPIELHDLGMIYDKEYINNEDNNKLLDNYYYACVSNDSKAKFLFLYLIFEYYIRKECPKDIFKKEIIFR